MKSNNQNSQKNPVTGKADFPRETETESRGGAGTDTSYSEQIDVTPNNKREVPSFGNAKTDFAARKQGRTTGTMLGHEPGIENGI